MMNIFKNVFNGVNDFIISEADKIAPDQEKIHSSSPEKILEEQSGQEEVNQKNHNDELEGDQNEVYTRRILLSIPDEQSNIDKIKNVEPEIANIEEKVDDYTEIESDQENDVFEDVRQSFDEDEIEIENNHDEIRDDLNDNENANDFELNENLNNESNDNLDNANKIANQFKKELPPIPEKVVDNNEQVVIPEQKLIEQKNKPLPPLPAKPNALARIPFTPAAIPELQQLFNADINDKKISPQKRLVTMMNAISQYDVDPNTFEIDFQLDGHPNATKIEPYKEGYKSKFKTILKYRDPYTGNTREFEFTNDLFSLSKKPAEFSDNAKGYFEGIRHIVFNKNVHESALEKTSLYILKDNSGKVTGVSTSDKKDDKYEIKLDSDYVTPQYHSEYQTRIKGNKADGIIKHSNYEIVFPQNFSPTILSQHLKIIEDRIKEAQKQFVDIQNSYGSYSKGRMWIKPKLKESLQFKILLNNLSVDDKKSQSAISPKTQEYLEKREVYKVFKQDNKNLQEILESLDRESNYKLSEDEKKLWDKFISEPEIKSKIDEIKIKLKAENPDLPIDSIELDKRINEALKEIGTNHLKALKDELINIATEIQKENQALLSQFYQMKDTIIELEAYKLELIDLKSKNTQLDNESSKSVDSLIKNIEKDVTKYETFITGIEKRLSTINRNPSNDKNEKMSTNPDDLNNQPGIENLPNDQPKKSSKFHQIRKGIKDRINRLKSKKNNEPELNSLNNNTISNQQDNGQNNGINLSNKNNNDADLLNQNHNNEENLLNQDMDPANLIKLNEVPDPNNHPDYQFRKVDNIKENSNEMEQSEN